MLSLWWVSSTFLEGEIFANFLRQWNAVWPRMHSFFGIDHMYPSLETMMFKPSKTIMTGKNTL